MDTSSIRRYIQAGKADINWYQDCEDLFVDLFGRHRLELVVRLFAATSINTSLKSNISLFRKALYEFENGLPVGDYLPNIKQQLYQVRSGGELTGRKISSFARAMSGDRDAVVVDVWLARAFDMERRYFRQTKGEQKGRGRIRSAGVSDSDYTRIERYIRRLAKRKGLEARQVSSMIWCGVRTEKTGDRETHYKNILRSHLTNLFNCI